jgi:hypothetical protein
MLSVLQVWHLLACIVAGYANREQQQLIDYLRTENAIPYGEKTGPTCKRLKKWDLCHGGRCVVRPIDNVQPVPHDPGLSAFGA